MKTTLKADRSRTILDAFAVSALADTTSALRPLRTRFIKALALAAAAALLLAPLPAAAQSSTTPPAAGAAPQPTAEPRIAQSREEWNAAMQRLAFPKKGCFTSAYPRIEWREIPCKAPPPYPQPPRRSGTPANIVGGLSGDFDAHVPGALSSVTGSFDSVPAGISETGTDPNTHVAGIANVFSLQLNTGPFSTPMCKGANYPPMCNGFQQFVFDSADSSIYIQYWLLDYGTNCPSGWTFFLNQGEPDCYTSTTPTPVPAVTIADLKQITMKATADPSGNDALIFTIGLGNPINATNQDSVLNLAPNWQDAEFNVFGDGWGTQAVFGDDTTLSVRTSVDDGTTIAPFCQTNSFTGETNDLTLTPPCCPYGVYNGAQPAIVFTQSNKPGETSMCINGTSVGDTHLSTVYGLLYDFQASGDFVLVETDHDFMVQTRQASGAPRWPNASVNKAVAVRLGQNRVAICLDPARLEIDGKRADLGDGKSLTLPGGVQVSRSGDLYVVARKSGEVVRAQLNAPTSHGWIDVSVDVGRWPQVKARGLLGNPTGVTDQIATRFGTVLREPVSFTDLYRRYADSWRVPKDESMICKDMKLETGIPTQPFYASDLDPKQRERALAVCRAAGVKNEALLEACVLDTTVIGNETAAKVFARLPAPRAVAPRPVTVQAR